MFSLQMTSVTPEYVAEIIDKFEVADENKQKGVLGIEGNIVTLDRLLILTSFFILTCIVYDYCDALNCAHAS